MTELRRGHAGRLKKQTVPERGFTKAKRKRFLDELAGTCNVAASARAAGVWPSTAHNLRRRDGVFAQLWADAIDEGSVRLEEELLAHALGQAASDENPDGERTAAETKPFDPDLAMKVLHLRARVGLGGKRASGAGAAAASAPSPADVDAALFERLQASAARTNRRRPATGGADVGAAGAAPDAER